MAIKRTTFLGHYTPTLSDVRAVLEVAGDDGHSLLPPEALIEAGASPTLARGFATTYKSDGTPKGTIFDPQGNIVESMQAVYSLALLQGVALRLDLRWEGKLGRGFEARAVSDALRAWLAAQDTPSASTQP